MRITLSVLFIILLSVADIFLFRIGVLPAEPSLSILPFFFALAFFNKKLVKNIKHIIGSVSLNYFFLLFVLSIIFSVNTGYADVTTNIGLIFLSLLLYIVAYLFCVTYKEIDVKFIFLIAYAILGLSVIYELIFSSYSLSRGAGFAENPNGTALRLVIMAVIILQYVKVRINKILLLSSLMILIVLTLSRSGMLMASFLLLINVVTNFNDSFKRISSQKILKALVLLSLFFVSFITVANFLFHNVSAFQNRAAQERIGQITGKEAIVSDSDYSSKGRITIFNDYLQKFIDNPIGYGTGASSDRSFYPKATHNMFLRLAIDFGAIGLIVFLLFLLVALRKSFRKNKLESVIFFMIIFIACFFTNTLFENRTFMIALAVIDFNRRNKLC